MKGLYKTKQQTYSVNTNNFAGLFDKMRSSFEKAPTYVNAGGANKQTLIKKQVDSKPDPLKKSYTPSGSSRPNPSTPSSVANSNKPAPSIQPAYTTSSTTIRKATPQQSLQHSSSRDFENRKQVASNTGGLQIKTSFSQAQNSLIHSLPPQQPKLPEQVNKPINLVNSVARLSRDGTQSPSIPVKEVNVSLNIPRKNSSGSKPVVLDREGPSERLRVLKELFGLLDSDKDGKLSAELMDLDGLSKVSIDLLDQLNDVITSIFEIEDTVDFELFVKLCEKQARVDRLVDIYNNFTKTK